jgi:adenosylcobinamide-GDP ribazoletransferase
LAAWRVSLLGRLWVEFWGAITFMTILPAPRGVAPSGEIGRAAVWFPLVGLLIGLLLWGVQWGANHLFDPWLAGVLVTTAWAVSTGALHLDGLADCCDGLLAPVSRERRLEILRDPRVGSFGAVGLVLVLLLKAAAAGVVNPVALLLAPTWARWLLLLAARQPQARPDGMGAAFAMWLTPGVLIGAAVVPVVLAVAIIPLRSLPALVVALAVCWGVIALAKARLGGVTGDVYGLVVELAEVAVLLVFAARPPAA